MSNNPLSVFNWSLKKALSTEPDSFIKARISIIFSILIFSLVKGAVVIAVCSTYEQWMQVARAVVASIIYISLIKVLLYRPSHIKAISHIMLSIGLLLVWTSVFIYAQKINLLSVQFVFMILLGSFYTLGTGWGLIYSVAAMLPMILFMALNGHSPIASIDTQEITSPGFEIIAILNFMSIMVCHYLFYKSYDANIREKEILNSQLQQSIADATKLAASKTNFLSTMSHELRTPLNSVIGITELLQEDKPEERQKENLKILHSSSTDLLALINNILDFNKVDSGMLVLENVSFNLSDFVQNTCAGLKVRANDKSLDFAVDIDEQLKRVNIISDPTRLSQLLYNLAGNAIKFTDKGCVAVKAKCINKTSDSADVLFTITDTGIGIHPDKHETIFESFTQAASHITREYGGTGLGLPIVQQVLQLFNSTLKLESSEGKGSTFSFRISFAIDTRAVQHNAPEISGQTDLSHLKILIAEDNEINRFLIKKQLDKLGVTATIVEHGMLAYEAHLAMYYDMILMDLHMPVSDGYQTTKMIRALPDPEKSGVYIIAFTASVSEQEQILEAGFNDYLYKPVNLKALLEKLEQVAGIQRVAVTA